MRHGDERRQAAAHRIHRCAAGVPGSSPVWKPAGDARRRSMPADR
ncbi:hypothetical protein [Nonomuraea zeae]|nr:hypothetical protein [Nonomuraea zeae]